jgi:opacity protein-like surface antigen
MKTTWKLSWFVLAMLVVVQAAEAQVLRVTERTVKLRSQPISSSRVVTTVNQGAMLEIVENYGTWYKVKVLSTGQVGHIHRSLVQEVQGQAVARPAAPRPATPPPTPPAAQPAAVPPTPPSAQQAESYARAQSMEEPPDSGVDFTLWGGLMDLAGSNLSGGGALSFLVGGPSTEIEMGGEYSHLGSGSADFTSSLGPSAKVSASAHLITIHGSFNYNFHLPQSRLVPYASAGMVYGRTSASATASLPDFGLEETFSASSSETAFQFGGGVKVPVGNGGRTFRGDIRFDLFEGDTATRLFVGIVF